MAGLDVSRFAYGNSFLQVNVVGANLSEAKNREIKKHEIKKPRNHNQRELETLHVWIEQKTDKKVAFGAVLL
jgi:hypothetical protein